MTHKTQQQDPQAGPEGETFLATREKLPPRSRAGETAQQGDPALLMCRSNVCCKKAFRARGRCRGRAHHNPRRKKSVYSDLRWAEKCHPTYLLHSHGRRTTHTWPWEAKLQDRLPQGSHGCKSVDSRKQKQLFPAAQKRARLSPYNHLHTCQWHS